MKLWTILFLAVLTLTFLASSATAATLTVTKQGTGDGLVTGAGIDCGADCTEVYPDESLIFLKATPHPDSTFKGWLVDGQPQQGALVIRNDMTVTAIFDRTQGHLAVELIGQAPNPEYAIVEQAHAEGKEILRAPNGHIVGFEYVSNEKLMVTLNSGNTFEVDRGIFEVWGSNDGQTLLQAGDPGCMMPFCSKMELLFYNGTGDLQQEIRGVHTPGPFAISEDGYVAIGGHLYNLAMSDEAFVTLYEPNGSLLWRHSLGADKRVRRLALSPSAETIAVIYTDRKGTESPDDSNYLLLLGKDGSVRFTSEQIPFNSLYVLEQGHYVAIDALETFFLRHVASGTPSWTVSSDYGPVGSHAIQILENRNLVMVVSSVYDPKQADEKWRLYLLSLQTGEELFVYEFPGRYEFYSGPVLVSDSEQSFTVTTPNELFFFRFTE